MAERISGPVLLFFAALFPQFLPADSGPAVLVHLVSTFVVVKFVVLGGYATGARHVVRLLRKPEHARRGQMLTGVIFVAFGVLMIWSALTATEGYEMRASMYYEPGMIIAEGDFVVIPGRARG